MLGSLQPFSAENILERCIWCFIHFNETWMASVMRAGFASQMERATDLPLFPPSRNDHRIIFFKQLLEPFHIPL